jgi:hypothetical protein
VLRQELAAGPLGVAQQGRAVRFPAARWPPFLEDRLGALEVPVGDLLRPAGAKLGGGRSVRRGRRGRGRVLGQLRQVRLRGVQVRLAGGNFLADRWSSGRGSRLSISDFFSAAAGVFFARLSRARARYW